MATFTEEFTRMRQDFDQAQADRHQLFDDTREHVQNMVHGVKEQLAGFRHDLHEHAQRDRRDGQPGADRAARLEHGPEHRRQRSSARNRSRRRADNPSAAEVGTAFAAAEPQPPSVGDKLR